MLFVAFLVKGLAPFSLTNIFFDLKDIAKVYSLPLSIIVNEKVLLSRKPNILIPIAIILVTGIDL